MVERMTPRVREAGAGLGLGIGLGVLFWLLFDNVALFPLWVAVGLVLGTASSRSADDGDA